jgi:hypothetical protein
MIFATVAKTHIPCPLTLVLKTVITNPMIFATVAKIKKLLKYCPNGTTYPIGRNANEKILGCY